MTISPDLEAQILRYYHVEKWRVGTIARQLHVHHGTVARVLAQAGLPRIGPPARWMRLARSELDTAACSILNRSRRSASELLASAGRISEFIVRLAFRAVPPRRGHCFFSGALLANPICRSMSLSIRRP